MRQMVTAFEKCGIKNRLFSPKCRKSVMSQSRKAVRLTGASGRASEEKGKKEESEGKRANRRQIKAAKK